MRRRGISLLEVLFAILVVSIGLLAALAVFPVSASLARKGQRADMSAVAGRSAVHAFDTRGMRQPARWLIFDPLDALNYVNVQPAFNQAYCLDPRSMSANSANPNPNAFFPYGAAAGQPVMVRITLDRMGVNPAGQLATTGLPMSQQLADSVFRLEDDLTVNRPADRSLPAYGVIDGERVSDGHYSWMATIVPRQELYATPAVVANQEYLLSVVVFHDRPGDMLAGDPRHERIVTADFADAGGLGYAGGEVYLTSPTAAPLEGVRAGDWLMLGRSVLHVSGVAFPRFRWYRVAEADHEPEWHAAENHYALAASLSGPDWDIAPSVGAAAPEPTIAVLMEGVVAVYEKTVRLEPGVE